MEFKNEFENKIGRLTKSKAYLDFCIEGCADLYESKLEETLIGKKLFDNGRASRFLYIIK